jgi:pimeloyl-ACP methyl ester carboxylesterase
VTNYQTTFVHPTTPWGASFFPKGGIIGAGGKDFVLIGAKKHAISRRMLMELCLLRPDLTTWTASPLLVLHGAHDSIVSLQDSRRFVSRHFDNTVTLHEFPNAEHGLEENRSEAISMTINYIGE